MIRKIPSGGAFPDRAKEVPPRATNSGRRGFLTFHAHPPQSPYACPPGLEALGALGKYLPGSQPSNLARLMPSFDGVVTHARWGARYPRSERSSPNVAR